MAIAALAKRYPSLAFLLLMEGENLPFFSQDANQKEVHKKCQPADLKDVEVLYVYGLGAGTHYLLFKEWLSEDRKRDLVFLEEHLSVLKQFLKQAHAKEILSHPQVHIRFNLNWQSLSAFAEECATSFPAARIEVVALLAYQKRLCSRFYRLRLMLHRKTTVSHALFYESQYYHHFIDHFLSNFYRLGCSFDGNGLKNLFKGIPAIVCGAGPSLTKEIETLRTLQDKALIFAGGSAIPALTVQGIMPHFGVAYDPNQEEFERFKQAQAFEIPILYASRLYPHVFNTCNGPSGYLHSQTGGWAEYWVEKHLNLKQNPLQSGLNLEALSVTTAALQLACTYGCNPIILLGVDLAFTDSQLYASGVVPNSQVHIANKKGDTRASEKLLVRKDQNGNLIFTLVKWVMERDAIHRFIKKNPSFTFLNATSGGLGFKDIPYSPLEEISFKASYDLSGKVHKAIQTHSLGISLGQVKEMLMRLKESLSKGAFWTSSALQELQNIQKTGKDPETGKLILAQMELEALDAYAAFLRPFDRAFPILARRKYRPLHWKETLPHVKWKILYSKWSAYHDFMQFYQQKIDRFLMNGNWGLEHREKA